MIYSKGSFTMQKKVERSCKPGQTMDAKDMVTILLGDFHIDVDDPRLSLKRKWKDFVGEKCASHTSPTDIRNDVLYVCADHPVWVQLLSMQQHQIVSRLYASYPSLSIKRLQVHLFR